ncbi:hypothetical protein GGTG_05629 [Gaeumannomyces tritici R3-111a-1]|uniref:Uncharacterized protein n=1 Tax=Gaeumannomyces tritici (strain R3-111a-1) TaxID=644352 RepID=J3NWG5_GAET3|nr:hypothetical protein GGTG_05629 [Gaeumannomyces tritici R3-111a-1]EJT75697.1 hypothetical protein GGTG_05629 [Gaeumannomyces tritici R3-111a-1]
MTISPVAHRPATPVIKLNVWVAFPKGSEPYILHQQGGRASVCVGPAAADRPRPGPNEARSDRPDIGHAATQTDPPTQIEVFPDRPGVVCATAQAGPPAQTDAQDGGNADRPQACALQEYQLTPKQLKFLRIKPPCSCRNRRAPNRPGPDNLDPQSRVLERGVSRPVPNTSTKQEDMAECLFAVLVGTTASSVTVCFLSLCGICKPESKLKIGLVLGLLFSVVLVNLSLYCEDESPFLRTGHICRRCRGVTVAGRMHLSSLRKSKSK